jgi:hypothetical protein
LDEVATLQVWPFHVRTWVEIFGALFVHVPPTAVHVVALKQLTPWRKSAKAGGVLGVSGSRVHAEPFHVSITFSNAGPLPGELAPTATQKPVPTHEMLSRPEAVGEGVDGADQVVPFQNKLQDTMGVPYCPTAMQFAGVLQESARGVRFVTPATAGNTVALQVDPFHCSMKACDALVPVEPTAKQRLTLVQDTEPSVAALLGALPPWTTEKLLPFHCRIRGDASLEIVSCPAATQKVVVTHETWSTSRLDAPAGTGSVTSDQVVPFHCWA